MGHYGLCPGPWTARSEGATTDLPLRVFGLLCVGRHGHHKQVLQDKSSLKRNQRGGQSLRVKSDSVTLPSACDGVELQERCSNVLALFDPIKMSALLTDFKVFFKHIEHFSAMSFWGCWRDAQVMSGISYMSYKTAATRNKLTLVWVGGKDISSLALKWSVRIKGWFWFYIKPNTI